MDSSFLGRCAPWAKLTAFFLLLPSVVGVPILSPMGLVGALLIVGSLAAARLSPRESLMPVKRLRWLYLFLFLLHGLMTPGEPLMAALPLVTREGVRVGGEQALRLTLLAWLAWALMRSTPPLHVASGLRFLLGWLEPLGVPVRRGVALLAYTLTALGRLHASTRDIMALQSLRLGEKQPGLAGSMARLSAGGGALLTRMLDEVHVQEMAMKARGFDQELPFTPSDQPGWGWRDGVILTAPVLPILLTLGR